MRDIGTLGGYGAQALGLNERGQVTGYSNLSQFSGQHAFLYSDGVMHDLGTPAGGSFSVGTGINNAGQVVGYSDAAPGGGFLFSDGTMKLLGTLGGTYTIAYAINQRGQVTGGSAANLTPDNPFGVMHPFLYTQGVMRDIGNGWVHLGWGTALNEHGSVVGVAIIGEGASAEPHAFVYSQGVTTDLNALLDPVTGAGWVIREATGVNDRGEIVGSATRIGDFSTAYAVLLTPRR